MKKEIKKFPYLKSLDDLKQTAEAEGGFISIESAAKMLGSTKSQLLLLEKRGDISGYRIRSTKVSEDESVDMSAKDNIFVTMESVKAYQVRKQADVAKKAAAKAALQALEPVAQ